MSLEDNVNKWIEEQRRILIRKRRAEARREKARKAKFLRLNFNGKSRVKVDGKDLSVKGTGNVYSSKNDSVFLDDADIAEKRRKKKQVAEKAVKAKAPVIKGAQKKRDIEEIEEDVTPGVFFGFTTYITVRDNMDTHMLSLYEFYESFSNISSLVNLNFYNSVGMLPWLKDYNMDVGVTTVQSQSSFLGPSQTGIYDIVNYTLEDYVTADTRLLENNPDYSLSSVERSLWNRFLTDAVDNPDEFLQFYDSMQIEEFSPRILDYYNQKISYDDEDRYLFKNLDVDPIARSSNIIFCTKLDWTYWDLTGIRPTSGNQPPYTPAVFTYVYPCNVCGDPNPPLYVRRVATSVDEYGSDNKFASGLIITPSTSNNSYPETLYPGKFDIIGCDPDDPETFPCAPCNCGTGFFGCEYYTWAGIDCNGNSRSCDPYPLCSYEEIYSSTNSVTQNRTPFNTIGDSNSSGTYPPQCTPGLAASDRNIYSTVKLLTIRDSMVNTLLEAQRAGYTIFLDLDLRLTTCAISSSSLTSYSDLKHRYCDKYGGVLDVHTMMSLLNILDFRAFIITSSQYTSRKNSLSNSGSNAFKAAYNQETQFLAQSINTLFEELFSLYGPVSDNGLDFVKVFYCQLTDANEFTDKTGRVQRKRASDANSPLQIASSTLDNPIDSITARLVSHIKEARSWYSSPSTPSSALNGKPSTATDKYKYIMFALMCGFFGQTQLLEKDPDGDEKYLFQ